MRITCEECQAVFTINDSLINPQGIRAQCPRCGTQRTVHAENQQKKTAARPVTAAPSLAAANPFATFSPAEAEKQILEKTAVVSNPLFEDAVSQPSISPLGFDGPLGFGGENPKNKEEFNLEQQTQSIDLSSMPREDFNHSFEHNQPSAEVKENPFQLSAANSNAGSSIQNPFEINAPASTGVFTSPSKQDDHVFTQESPFTQSEASHDMFAATDANLEEQSIGLELSIPSMDNAPLTQAVVEEKKWQLKTSRQEYQNLSLEQLRDMIRAGEVQASDLASYMGELLIPVSEIPILSVSLPKAKLKREEYTNSRKRMAAQAQQQSSNKNKLLFIAAAFVVLIISIFTLKTLFHQQGPDQNNPFLRAIHEWRTEYSKIEGNAETQFVTGLKYQASDTAIGYKKADTNFKKALILEPDSLKSIAAYVENYTHLPEIKVRAYPQNIQLAKEGIKYALELAPNDPKLIHAQASLLSVLGEDDTAQKLLLLYQRRNPEQVNNPEVLYLLAKTSLKTTPLETLHYLKTIKQTYEKKNIITLEAAAQRRLGNYDACEELLKKRLKLNPGNSEALFELAHLWLDLSQGKKALEPLEKLILTDGQNVEARLLKAIIQYQINEDYQHAEDELQFIKKHLKLISGTLYVKVLSHLAFIQIQNGHPEEALKNSQAALENSPNSLSALYIYSLALQKNNEYKKADKLLIALNTKIANSALSYQQPLILTQLAKVELAISQHKLALKHFSEAIKHNSEYMPAYLGLASAHMSVGENRQAATVIRRSLSIDPLHNEKFKELTDFPEDKNHLQSYLKIYKESTSSKIGYALKLAAQGVLQFHSKDYSKASKSFRNALVLDKYNHISLLYLAIIQIRKGQHSAAYTLLSKAVKTTARTHRMTQTYLAYSELKIGRIRHAEKRISKVLDNDITFIFARLIKANLLLLQAKRNISSKEYIKKTKDILIGILKEYPNYAPAKKLLGQI